MDGDGLLTNFVDAGGALPIRATLAYKGGRWTDRVRAKRAAQYWEKKQLQLAANGAEDGGGGGAGIAELRSQAEGGGAGGRGNKRKRGDEGGGADGDGDGDGDSRPMQRPRSGRVARGGGGGGRRVQSKINSSSNHAPTASEKGRQFISSLWTYNPTTTTTTTATAPVPVPETEQTPTNAPLSDGSATFTTLGLSPSLSSHLATKLLLKAPTAIQKAAIPELLSSSSDAFIQAQTGSGKTLTYLLPILDRIQSLCAVGGTKLDRSSGLFALVLAPTRELAAQILTVLTQLLGSQSLHWITPACVTGGEKRKSEKARLRKGCNILIATPGRLLDHLEMTESLDVANVRWMVMDEGDRLADQGFEKEIAKIVEIVEKRSKFGIITSNGEDRLPKRRITILCSATLGAGVQKLGDISLKEASFIKADPASDTLPSDTDMGPMTEKFLAPAQLRQSYVLVPAKQRYVALYAVLKRAFLRASPNMKVIVFFSCADSVDFYFEAFSRSLDEQEQKINKKRDDDDDDDINKQRSKTTSPPKKPPHPTTRPAPLLHDSLILCKLHGSLPQAQRTESLKSFTTGHPPPKKTSETPPTSHPTLLFSTDVSSRGLDLPNVDLIVQFDPPFSHTDYLHRIGRTARAGRPGRATIFLLPGTGEEAYPQRVIARTGDTSGGTVREHPVAEVLARGFGSAWEQAATTAQLALEEWLRQPSAAFLPLAKRAWASHLRAYATHAVNERDMFGLRDVHVGHLAKAFGLRERPGEISNDKKGGKGAGKEKSGGGVGRALEKVVARREGGARWDREDEVGKKGMRGGEQEARDRMRRMARVMQGRGRAGVASEFNIG